MFYAWYIHTLETYWEDNQTQGVGEACPDWQYFDRFDSLYQDKKRPEIKT